MAETRTPGAARAAGQSDRTHDNQAKARSIAAGRRRAHRLGQPPPDPSLFRPFWDGKFRHETRKARLATQLVNSDSDADNNKNNNNGGSSSGGGGNHSPNNGYPGGINLLAIVLLTLLIPVAEAVDCFKCSSRNGSNPACEDPFHNLNSTRITSPIIPDPTPNVIYHTPCYAGKKGREGLFPASACIKLTGTFDTTGETLVVRHCALDSGTLTQDTELGCVLACPEDACNSAPPRLARASQLAGRALPYLALLVLIRSLGGAALAP